MSLRQALDQATARLASAGIADPRLDAELLAAHIWDVSPGRLRALIHTDPADGDSPRLARLAAAVSRRAERVPLQHITGRAPFRHLELAVGPGVFIPRPETEVTAELAIQAARAFQGAAAGHLGGAAPGGRAGQVGGAEPVSAAGPVRVVDLGTGSGAIAAAVATEVPGAEVWAIESQPEAHSWAARNLANLPVHLLLADATRLANGPDTPAVATPPAGPDAPCVAVQPTPPAGPDAPGVATQPTATRMADTTPAPLPGVPAELAGRVDVVVSNPPYIPDGCRPLDPEVALHDPPAALYGGGVDGMRVPDGIVGTAVGLLRPGGVLIMEHGAEQGEAMRTLAAHHGLVEITTHQDLAGRDRVLRAKARREGL